MTDQSKTDQMSDHRARYDCDPNNVPEKHVRWVNIYPATGTVYVTKHEADVAGGFSRLACVRIECEEGDGL